MKNKDTSIRRNALLNVCRQVCTIVFPFLTFSYASHTLGAEALGKYTFGQSIVSYFNCFCALGISDYAVREAAPLRGDPGKLKKFADEVFSIQLLLLIVSYAALFLLLGSWAKLRPYRKVILILSIQLILTVAGADWVNTAFEDFFYLAVRYFVTASACTAAVFYVVNGPQDVYWYTLFSMLCAAGGNLWNVFYIRRYVKPGVTMRLNVRKHLPPMLLFFCNSMALVIYLNADITILGMYADDAAVGTYSVATKIYLMAKALINAVILPAVPRLSQIAAEKKENADGMLSGIADLLCMLLIPAAVGIFCEAPNLIWLVGGSGYLEGAEVLRIYSVTILFAVGACFFSYAVLIPFHMEKYFLLSTVMAAALNIGTNFWLIPRFGMCAAALTTLLAELMVCMATSFYAKKRAGVKLLLLIHKKDLWIELAGGAAVGAACFAIKQLGLSHALELGASVILAAAAYSGVLLGMKNQTLLALLKSVAG